MPAGPRSKATSRRGLARPTDVANRMRTNAASGPRPFLALQEWRRRGVRWERAFYTGPRKALAAVRFTPGSRDVDREAAISDSLIVSEERPHIAAFVAKLHDASDAQHFQSLQDALLRRMLGRQTVTDELGADIRKTKQELRQLTAGRPLPRDEVSQLQAVLAKQELAERCCKAVAHVLRCVGDGIAWKALRYDRRAISILGSGKRVGRLADSRGLEAELRVADDYRKQGRFALHNDLTNCLRTGDLTLPFEPDGVLIREVKAGSGRPSAQTEAAEARMAFLRNGRGSGVIGDVSARVARYPVALRTGLTTLRQLLHDARRDGYATARPSPSISVVAVDPRVSGGNPGIDVVVEQARGAAGWYDDPRIVRTLTLVRRARERIHHYPYLAPLTIYPLDPEDICELLLGPLDYISTLHAPTLEREFSIRGMRAQVLTSERSSSRVFLRATRGDSQVELPALVCEQLLTELMDPGCLVDAVEMMLDEIDNDGATGAALVCLAGERFVWA